MAAKVDMAQDGNNILFNLTIVPYMSVINKQDIFLISQEVHELMLDDDRCYFFLKSIINGLTECSLKITINNQKFGKRLDKFDLEND